MIFFKRVNIIKIWMNLLSNYRIYYDDKFFNKKNIINIENINLLLGVCFIKKR